MCAQLDAWNLKMRHRVSATAPPNRFLDDRNPKLRKRVIKNESKKCSVQKHENKSRNKPCCRQFKTISLHPNNSCVSRPKISNSNGKNKTKEWNWKFKRANKINENEWKWHNFKSHIVWCFFRAHLVNIQWRNLSLTTSFTLCAKWIPFVISINFLLRWILNRYLNVCMFFVACRAHHECVILNEKKINIFYYKRYFTSSVRDICKAEAHTSAIKRRWQWCRRRRRSSRE